MCICALCQSQSSIRKSFFVCFELLNKHFYLKLKPQILGSDNFFYKWEAEKAITYYLHIITANI